MRWNNLSNRIWAYAVYLNVLFLAKEESNLFKLTLSARTSQDKHILQSAAFQPWLWIVQSPWLIADSSHWASQLGSAFPLLCHCRKLNNFLSANLNLEGWGAAGIPTACYSAENDLFPLLLTDFCLFNFGCLGLHNLNWCCISISSQRWALWKSALQWSFYISFVVLFSLGHVKGKEADTEALLGVMSDVRTWRHGKRVLQQKVLRLSLIKAILPRMLRTALTSVPL